MVWNESLVLNSLKRVGVFLLLIIIGCCLDIDTVLAHSPHDVVLEVELSPDYAQDQTVYALLDGYLPIWGNLFRSQDSGDTWTRIEKGLDNQHQLVSLAVSAKSKQTMFLTTLGDGIYKSQNGGASWQQVNQGLEVLSIDQVEIAPNSTDLVFAAGTESGLYKTENGGDNWLQVMTEEKIKAIAFMPEDSNRLIVGDEQGNLFSSSDRGKNWEQLTTLNDSGAIQTIAISPNYQQDRLVWVGTEKAGIWEIVDGGDNLSVVNISTFDDSIMSLVVSPDYGQDSTIVASTWHKGVFRSDNGGKSWKKQIWGLKKHSQADTAAYKKPHFSDLKISPTFGQDRTLLLAGFDGIFKSTNGGSLWRDVNIGKGATSIRNIALSPNYQNDGTVAISTIFQGVYLSRDRGANWTAINRGLGTYKLLKQNLIAETGSLVFSPNYGLDNTLLASSWGSLNKTTNQGKFWHKFWVPKRLRRDSYMVVSPNFASDRTIFLATLPGKILKSTDGGKNFNLAGELKAQAAFIPSLVISPNFAIDQTLYLGNFAGGVYKSVDGGNTWQPTNNGLTVQDDFAKLAISSNYQADHTVFAGTKSGLFITGDGGISWRKLPSPAFGRDSYIETIAVSPSYQSDRTFLVSVRDEGLFKTSDGGETFSRIGDYLTGEIKFSPTYKSDQTIYYSSGAELYQSTNGGETWQNIIIPQPDYGWLTILNHLLLSSSLGRYLAAAAIALLSYAFLGWLRFSKKFSIKKWQLKTTCAFTVFVGVLGFLSV